MNTFGKVVALNKADAIVEIKRNSPCASCHNCEAKGACHTELVLSENNGVILISVENSVGAVIGDKVSVVSTTGGVLFASFVSFIFPIIISFITYFLSSEFTDNIAVNTVISVAVFVVSFFSCVSIMNVYVKKHITFRIEKIIKEKDCLEGE